MSGRGHLQLLPAPEDRPKLGEGDAEQVVVDTTADERLADMEPSPGRRLAPNAPKSPGTVPLELARELRTGEPVIWWNEKREIVWRHVLWVLGAGLALLAFATLLAPELWLPLAKFWQPLLPAIAPAALLAAREWLSRRAVMVTDNSVIVVDHRGRADRLGFRNVRRVRRDLLTGGVLLEGARHRLRIPPLLAEDARAAIASQTALVRGSPDAIDDPLGWMP